MTIRYVDRIDHRLVDGTVEHVVTGEWQITGETFYKRKIIVEDDCLVVGDQRIGKDGKIK